MSDTKRANSLPPVTLAGTELVVVLANPAASGPLSRTTTQAIANLAPVSSADFLVKTANAGLSAERVVTDTATIATDWATAGQAKIGVVAGSIGPTQLATGAGNPIIAGGTVAANGTITNNKNITSAPFTGGDHFVVTVTENTATKYQPQATITTSDSGDTLDIAVEKVSATVWNVFTKQGGVAGAVSFSFTLLSLD